MKKTTRFTALLLLTFVFASAIVLSACNKTDHEFNIDEYIFEILGQDTSEITIDFTLPKTVGEPDENSGEFRYYKAQWASDSSAIVLHEQSTFYLAEVVRGTTDTVVNLTLTVGSVSRQFPVTVKGKDPSHTNDNINEYDHTIVFYSAQNSILASITDNAIANFENNYHGWTVKHVQLGGFDNVFNKVSSDLTAGTQPDLAYCYPEHVAQYLSSGKVVDINKYLLNNDFYSSSITNEDGTKTFNSVWPVGFTQSDVDSFVKGYFNEGKISNYTLPQGVSMDKDAIVTLPFIKSTELLYYNPDALAELNVDVPTTWDELWAICAKAKAKWPICTPLGYDSEANWFVTMAAQRGFGYTSADASNHYLFNNDGAAEWLNEIKGYYDKGYIITQQLYGSYTNVLFTKGPADGGLVFYIGSSDSANYQAGIDFTTEVAPIPGTPVDAQGKPVENEEAANYDHTDYSCISQGPSLVMLTGGNGVADPTEKEIMTFQFVKELLSVKFQSQFARASRYNPMREDVYEDETYKTFLEGKDVKTGDKLTGAKLVVSKAAKTAKELTERFFTSPAFVGSSVARAQMTSVVQYVLLGQKDASRALYDAYKACGGK